MFKGRKEPFAGIKGDDKLDDLPSIPLTSSSSTSAPGSSHPPIMIDKKPDITRKEFPMRNEMLKPQATKNPIEHPNHYNQGAIECWDYVISHDMGFLQGNIIKYITRYKEKGGKEDLLKAYEYLKKLMEVEYKEKI